jgi:hypothetical protein
LRSDNSRYILQREIHRRQIVLAQGGFRLLFYHGFDHRRSDDG